MANNQEPTNAKNGNSILKKASQFNIFANNGVKNMIHTIDNMIGQASLNLYGTDRKSEVSQLDSTFYDIMKKEINGITDVKSDDTTSFLAKLLAGDRKDDAMVSRFIDGMNGVSGSFSMGDTSVSAMNSFLETVYQNRLMEQNDLHQVSTQLIELQEAVLITRDAIVSSNTVEGRMNRTLSFDGIDDGDDDYIPIVEQIEDKFHLQDRIKNFIVPFTLEYGEYYAYIIPYSKLFADFMRNKQNIINNSSGIKSIGESVTVLESASEDYNKAHPNRGKDDNYLHSLFESYMEQSDPAYKTASPMARKKMYAEVERDYKSDVSAILERVEICNDPSMAIPFIEEGFGSFNEFTDIYLESNGNQTPPYLTKPIRKNASSNPFDIIQKTGSVDGIYSSDGKNVDDNDFSDVKDVFIRMVDPTKIIPIEIMDETIGYYLVYTEETTKLHGLVSADLGYQGIYGSVATSTFMDELCEKIVRSFDKKFLTGNVKFKRLIAQAINYYNLSQNRVKFQYVPAEYIVNFKVDKDVNGHGQSICKKSLFYAKMYLMLLMFKLLSIVMNSNDTKVNYVKQSGLQKNHANKIQEIIRRKQSRNINMYDLYNYSTLINKIGSGSEMYVPVGRSGERPIETEILAGQDIQLNTELMEILKNSYILGTGVPAAIVNYLNEADFAKVIEQNQSKYNARVVNYQLDFNPSITDMYTRILRWVSNIPEDIIERFRFAFQPPKIATAAIKSEQISTFQGNADFIIRLFMGAEYDPQNPDNIRLVKHFMFLLAEEQFPSLNIQHLKELFEKAKLEATEDKLTPNPANKDNGDDIGLGDLENDLNDM